MYNPEKLEEYAHKIYARYEYFNNYTLETIARRIKATGKLSAHDQQALKNIVDITGDMKAITKKLAEITRMNVSDIEKLYTQVVSDGVNTYKPLYDFRDMKFVPFEENDFAQQLVRNWAKETIGTMLNLSQTKALCFDKLDADGNVIGSTPLKGAFERAISEAVQAVSRGTVDFNTAMAKTVERLGGSGVKVAYGSGVNRSLSAMIRQNLLYGAKQAAQSYDQHVGDLLECDGFEVDAHAGCRPTHEFMQGQMYSYHGEKTVDGVTYEDGTEALTALKDYGCLHFKTDVILGVSSPRYSPEELERIHRETTELIEYNGKKKTLYEWKQTQRSLERAIRIERQKAEMFKAAGMKQKAQECNTKSAVFRAKYDDMCSQIKGMSPRPERMRIYKDRDLTKSEHSGIIKSQGDQNMRINNIDSPIEQRNTAKGNPNAILQVGRPLNNRQQRILDNLYEYDSRMIIEKKAVNMRDLSALTAITGDEFALFTKGTKRLVIRGNSYSVNIDEKVANDLRKEGYKWSGHTHPGTDANCLIASPGDMLVLNAFGQTQSLIYNSKGQFEIFKGE